ncbi:MAG: GNAT family N-acetyltransferase [Lachnospiraceae bacterium]|nr:GNAT family N-acetyltransferase [Lachnospiraceae bacterium]
MEIIYGSEKDIDMWMKLVVDVRKNFPGLETEAGLQDHKRTVLRFMDKKQAICIKEENIIIGVMLFSRVHNMICCLAVLPQHRRKGAASRLLDTALHEWDRGRNIIVSTFREGDMKELAPRALYKKYGFVEGELTTEFDYPNQIFVLKPEPQ